MELHPTSSTNRRQEIQCHDCGHRFFIARGQRSSRCDKCGNIAFYAENVKPLEDLAARSPMEVLQARVWGRIHEALPAQSAKVEDPLLAFASPVDGQYVQKIIMQYQVEWQLWAMVVKKFEDPAYHMAYISAAFMRREFAQAARRYTNHRKAMAALPNFSWQAEVADTMLARIENLALMPVNLMQETWKEKVPDWMLSQLWESRLFRFGFFIFALILFMRIFRWMFLPHY